MFINRCLVLLFIILLFLLIKYIEGESFIKMRGIFMLNYIIKYEKLILIVNFNKKGLNGIVWFLCFMFGLRFLNNKVSG